ncbi:SAM-dependent methyltransferase [Actinomadura sp. 9N407]|uniref:SAM-dependent methyltransferase n=1 Tax=Actinomadura sp. 9N407 TaxID=3375154 RepID=UPI0037BC9CF6
MSPDPQAPADIDVEQPSAARVHDYMLGGKDNYDVDRMAADQILAVAPEMGEVAVENRRFLVRTVRSLTKQGHDQFLDLGSGLPTRENVHEVAQAANPDARVVYVDRDPMVLSHARALLGAGPDTIDYVHADVRDPAAVLDAPRTRKVLDFSRPVVVLFVAVLHFVADEDDPAGLVRRYVEALPSGSRVVIACGSSDHLSETIKEKVRQYFTDVPSPLRLRPRARIAELFGDLPLEEPGLVHVTDWPSPGHGKRLPMTSFGGVAHVP